MLKRKPPNNYRQMFPHYERKHVPKQSNIDFESAKEVLKEAYKKRLRKDVLRGYLMQ